MQEIGPATPMDAAHIADLLEQLTGQPACADEVEVQIKQLCHRDNVRMLVFRRDGAAVGFLMGILCPHIHPGFSPYLQMEALVVDETFRRKGAAKALVLELERWAEERSCRYITLASQSHRTAAHSLYRSLGYGCDAAFQKFLPKEGKR